MNPELSKLIYSITAFQLFFMAWIVLFIKTTPRYSYWLSAFLFLKSVLLAFLLGRWFYQVIPFTIGFQLIHTIGHFSLHPVFFLYVIKASRQSLPSRAYSLLALIPYSFAIAILYLPTSIQDTTIIRILGILNYNGQALIYFTLSLNYYQRFRNDMRNYLTEDIIQSLRWLRLCIYGFIILWSWSAILSLLQVFFPADHSLMNIVIEICFLITIHVLLFMGMRQPVVVKETLAQSNKKDKYAFSTLSQQSKQSLLIKLNQLMAEKRYYRTPNLTLKALAQQLNTPEKHLSQVINECCRQNFCEYINTLRLGDAKEQLSNPENSHKTILEIIYETGFNSKSVFNSLFKEETGLTPSAFRKEMQFLQQAEL